MSKTITCTEEFSKTDLAKPYSPLCRHHLFEDEAAAAELDEVYKRIQAKIYMRLIFTMGKDFAKDISKEAADILNKKIIDTLNGNEYITVYIIVERDNVSDSLKNNEVHFELKHAFIIFNKDWEV